MLTDGWHRYQYIHYLLNRRAIPLLLYPGCHHPISKRVVYTLDVIMHDRVSTGWRSGHLWPRQTSSSCSIQLHMFTLWPFRVGIVVDKSQWSKFATFSARLRRDDQMYHSLPFLRRTEGKRPLCHAICTEPLLLVGRSPFHADTPPHKLLPNFLTAPYH